MPNEVLKLLPIRQDKEIRLKTNQILLKVHHPVTVMDLGGHWWKSKDGMQVAASYDHTPHGTLLHISCSFAHRLPSYNEIKALREAFFPMDIDVMQVFPAQAKFVNLHPYCLHLWQSPFDWQVVIG